MIRDKGDGEITVKSRTRAAELTEILLEENYIVMLSLEEDLIVINYMWEPHTSRDGAVFMRIEDHEENFVGYDAYRYLLDKEENQ